MTESYAFFGGTPEDPRQYNQTEFAEVLERFFRNGYFPGVGMEVAVFPTDPARLAVRVGTGQAWINGYWYKNDTWKEIDLAPADGTNARIDRIVLRLDTVNARNIGAVVKTGIPAANPTAPDLERTEQIYELSLATVRVNSGATSITASNITDTRDDEILCGRAVPWNVPTDEDLYQHVSDNVRHITAAERSSWNAKETPAGAQAKADAALQAAKEWANAENVTVISPIAADVPGSEYPYGVTMFNFINVHGYPVDQGTALNINDPNPYRFTQIITYSTQNNTFAGETLIRIWRQDYGWSPFRKIWDSNNLPNPAQTDVANAFTQNQVIDKNIPLLLVRSRHTTGNVAGMQMQDAGGSNKWVAGFSPSVGTYSVYDYEAGHTALMIEPGAIGRMLYRGNEVWHTGNQGNPNNLNTSSKQIVGAINELFTTVSDGKQAIRDAIADAGGTPPSGSPDQYTHQDLANAISTVSKYASGEEPTTSTTSMTVQVRGIDFSEGAFYFFYQTNDDGAVSGMFRLDQPYNAFIRQSNTVASAPTITPVTGGFDITISRPADTGFDWEAWGK